MAIKPAGLIAVMGATGTGKSSIINAIVGKDVTDVGYGIESQTSNIKEYDFLMNNGLHVTLVDTPGFSDFTADTGGKSDLVILKEIGAFLKAKYDEGRMFSGILYLHNICDPRVGSSLQRNMTMFKKLCGPDPLKNVVVVTTFWDEIKLLQGIENETELKTKDRFFKGLVEGKSKFVRYGKFPPGEIPKGPEFLPPISIVSELVALDPVFVKMQKELAEGKTVEETSAGAELYKELRQLKLQQKKDVIDLNQKIGEMKAQNLRDRLAREALEDESKALKDHIKEWEARQHELHLAVRSGRSEWASAIAQLKQEKETSVKVRSQSMIAELFVKVTQQRDLELENSRQAELRSEMELLKTLHAKEILECQFQIRSLLDGNSIDAFRKTQLEKTCEDLKATVSDLSLSLTMLRDTNEGEAVERIDVMRQCNQLRANAATHGKTLDDLAEARSNITQLKSQLQVSQTAQERTASELEKVKLTLASVKDGAEIAATTEAKTFSEPFNMVRAALADAERHLASERSQARLILAKVRSELRAANKRSESQSETAADAVPASLHGTWRSFLKSYVQQIEPVFLVAVMGATGVGKSSLIKTITGIQTDVANDLDSGTSEVKDYFFHHSNGQPFLFLDTPGIDNSARDSKRSDIGTVMMLKSFLKERYDDSRKLSGLLYLHNIQDEHDKGPSRRCFTMMKSLCAQSSAERIVVITTFWDKVPIQEGVKYEDRLRKKDPYKMSGAKFVRWQNNATDKGHTDMRVGSLIDILSDPAALSLL